MTLGFVMLAHEALHRAAQVARFVAREGCPVIIHVDKRVPDDRFRALVSELADQPLITMARRFACHWGTWSLVEASRSAAAELLDQFSEIKHVMLISGACLPIKPLDELKAYLAARADTDFIESVTIEDVPWTKGGLSEERFSFTFPFAWKRNRTLFDLWVAAQRRAKRRRPMPSGLSPHLGSQWWCLTRPTLRKILDDPAGAQLEQYFRQVWIPDESYFQTLVRYYGCQVESRSLTLARFDFQGKPHLFYDDHVALLADSQAFFARKIWPGADVLYGRFLSGQKPQPPLSSHPSSDFADRLFGDAVAKRTAGRAGLALAGRFPREGFENGVTAAEYAVFHGFDEVLRDFPDWVSRETGSRVHGNLFAPERAVFADGETGWAGALSDSAALRDYDPEAFLRNLIWNTRGEHQSFLLSARDRLAIGNTLARDRNARIFVLTGAWIIPLLKSQLPVGEVRVQAAALQKAEVALVSKLQERRSQAQVRVWSLADLLECPSEPLQQILDDLAGAALRTLNVLPAFRDLSGLTEMIQSLRNAGMNPHVAGDMSGVGYAIDAVSVSNVVRLR